MKKRKSIIIIAVVLCLAVTLFEVQQWKTSKDIQNQKRLVSYYVLNNPQDLGEIPYLKGYTNDELLDYLNKKSVDTFNTWMVETNIKTNGERLHIDTRWISKEDYKQIITEINNAKVVETYSFTGIMSDWASAFGSQYEYTLRETQWGIFFTVQCFGLQYNGWNYNAYKQGVLIPQKYDISEEAMPPFFALSFDKIKVSTDYEEVKKISEWSSLQTRYQIGWHDKYGVVMYESNAIGQNFSGTTEEIKKQMKEANYSEEEIVYKQQWCDYYQYLKNTKCAFIYNECMQSDKDKYGVRAEKPPTYIVYKITAINGEEIKF